MSRTAITAAFQVLLWTASTASAQVHMTKDEALRAYFPGAVVERSTAFLTEPQRISIQRSARAKVESKIVTYYVARQNGRLIGTAFFETQTIRTMPATYMVVVDPDTSVRAVEMLAFYEPPDYHPSDRWLQQFNGRSAGQDLYLKRGIHAIAGATLTAQAVTDGVRRLLTTYTEVVAPRITP